MCGIAGFVDFSGLHADDARGRLARMCNAIVHRGPDEEGMFVDAHAALGHRRLSIIDLGSGQQPMAAHDGALQIVFNGEIYNFQELRGELEARGHRFATHSDTEVILLAYAEWGERCLERLNGMFAFAIWNVRTRELFLARDRVGKKPLYYWRNGSLVAFASELKALRAGGLCPTDIDPEALDCYFSFGYIPAPRTIYQGVRKLPAAHWIRFGTAESARPAVEQRYWELSFAGGNRPRTLESAVDELETLLDDAVRCRLVSEVPLGAFLSGGIDSSLIVASMARALDRPVLTNSIGFDDHEHSEVAVAREIARHLGTDHREFTVHPNALDVLPKIAWHFDEPMADSSAVPTWYVCEMARKTVTVALSGDGGDEGFGGYTFRYLPHIFESRVRAALPAPVRRAAFGSLGRIWPASARLPRPLRLKTIFENLAVSDEEAFYRDLVWLRGDTREALYSPDFKQRVNGFTPMRAVAPYYCHNDAPDPLGRSQFTDIHFYMTDDVLVKVDRMSMAHALEVRSPLLDYRVLEFGARLPRHLKVDSRRGKLVLRALARKRLPQRVHALPKRGFSIPAARWLRNELRPVIEERVLNASGPARDWLERSVVRQLWAEHESGARDHSVILWALMSLELWHEAHRSAA